MTSEMERVIIFHEYGEPKHYVGLSALIKEQSWEKAKYVEFSPIKLFIKAIIAKRYANAIKALHDLIFLMLCYIFPSILRGRIAVVGIAPLDVKLIFMRRVLSQCRVIYHSSWLYWDGSKYPKNSVFFNKYIETCWHDFLTKDVAAFATVTDKVASQIQANFNIPAEKFTVVYHAFDEKIFTCSSVCMLDIPSVVYAGRLIENKGIHLILALVQNHPSIRFEFAGQGPIEDVIREKAKILPNLVFHGFVSDAQQLAKIFNRSQIILLPSLRTDTWEELFGIALVEAMACGCVPITTDHYGPKVIFDDGELLYYSFNECSFYNNADQAIKDLFSNPQSMLHFRQLAIDSASRFNSPSISKTWKRVISIAKHNTEHS